ncbi:MAG: hypothetical protein PVJ72_16680 [Gammaproteobacteria bacterium]|jgi:GH24 family phage-related lysozyme (muramidase)
MELDKTTDYAAELQDFLVGAEGAEYTPYADTAGIPSIGYGYNLQDRNVREAVLEILGFDVSGTELTGDALAAEQDYIAQITDAVNMLYDPNGNSLEVVLQNIMSARLNDARYSAVGWGAKSRRSRRR